MTIQYRLPFAGVLVLALALCNAGCGKTTEAKSGPQPASCHYYIFVDLTGGFSEAQRELWRNAAANIIAWLRPGDAVRVYPLVAHTGDVRPLFEKETLPPPEDLYDPKKEALLELAGAQRGATDAVQAALRDSSWCPGTDVFAALDRVRPDPRGRRLMLVFLSDMVNVNAELNMQTTPVPASRLPRILETVTAQHGWTNSSLAGAEVYCLLASPLDTRDARPVNSRRELERLWRTLFEALGASLRHFDNTAPTISY